MTSVAHDEHSTAGRVLELLQVGDLETLRERSKMMSFKQSADLLIPVIVALASADDGGADLDLQPAVGVALYQCLVRERLAGPSMDAVIAKVMSGEYKAPRELDKSIPRALEAIITRATRQRPEERFASLRHLGAALLPFASKDVRQSYGADLPKQDSNVQATLLRRLKQGDDLKLLAAALAIALPMVLAARQSEGKPAPTPSAEQSASPPPAEPSATREPTLETQAVTARAQEEPAPGTQAVTARAQEAPAPKVEAERPVPGRARANAASDSPAGSAAGPSKYPIDVAVEPSSAWIMLDNKAAGRGRLRRELPRDGKAHALHVGAPGYRVQALHFTDAPPPTSVVLAKRAR